MVYEASNWSHEHLVGFCVQLRDEFGNNDNGQFVNDNFASCFSVATYFLCQIDSER